MVSSAILCLLCLARDVAAAEGPARSTASPRTEGNDLFSERLLRGVEPRQDRAVVEVGADSDADTPEDRGVDIHLQRDRPVVELGQLRRQRLLVGVAQR